MRQRGRPSSASLAIVPTQGVLPGDRPLPPESLSPLERAVWQTVVARMPPAWFTAETWPVLVAYCRVVIQSDEIGRELARFQGGFPRSAARWKKYSALTRIQTALQAQIGNFAGKLRLTLQSRYDRQKAADDEQRSSSPYPKPWEKTEA